MSELLATNSVSLSFPVKLAARTSNTFIRRRREGLVQGRKVVLDMGEGKTKSMAMIDDRRRATRCENT